MTQPIRLQPGQYYHVYNRGNNRVALFFEERNYRYFLKLYAQHVEPMAETYAYCLLPNHFHFLVGIKDLTTDLRGFENLSGLKKVPSQCFSNLFNACAKAINRAYDRTGSLFQRPFGRIPVTSEVYLVHLVAYIHRNPQKHGLIDDFRAWPYSSYDAHLSQKPTRLQRDEVLAWFQGVTEFERAHRQGTEAPLPEPLVGEDFD